MSAEQAANTVMFFTEESTASLVVSASMVVMGTNAIKGIVERWMSRPEKIISLFLSAIIVIVGAMHMEKSNSLMDIMLIFFNILLLYSTSIGANETASNFGKGSGGEPSGNRLHGSRLQGQQEKKFIQSWF